MIGIRPQSVHDNAGRRPRARGRRRSRRQPLAGVLVAIEAPQISDEMCWAASAIDINGDGLSLWLPAEIQSGSEVLLTFRLGHGRAFHRVPGVLVRRDETFGVGAVEFRPWPVQERLDLVQHLLQN